LRRLSVLSGPALGLAATVLAASVMAHDGAHPKSKAGVAPASWDFTLPTLDGTRFVQAARIAGPLLVNFWGRDCAPCVAELPRLQAFADANPHWTVLLVSTDAPGDAREFVQRYGVTLPVLRSGANVAGLMRSAGNRSGGLPFSVALAGAAVCSTQAGELGTADLERWARECGVARQP